MRKQARPHPESEHHAVCPFCETACDTASGVRWCSGCGAEWSASPSGDVIFDSERKADRQTLAEAARADAPRPARGLDGAQRRRPRRLGKKR